MRDGSKCSLDSQVHVSPVVLLSGSFLLLTYCICFWGKTPAFEAWATSPSHSITILAPQSSPCHGIFHLGLPVPPSTSQSAYSIHVFLACKKQLCSNNRRSLAGGRGMRERCDSWFHSSVFSPQPWLQWLRPIKNRKLKIVSQSGVLKGTINPLPSGLAAYL